MVTEPLHSSSSPLVGVVMGSDSDWRVMSDASQALTDFGIPHEVEVVSAHRTPDKLMSYAREARGRSEQPDGRIDLELPGEQLHQCRCDLDAHANGAHGVAIGEAGSRYGAEGEGPSLYVTDPEGNVVELKGPPWPAGA